MIRQFLKRPVIVEAAQWRNAPGQAEALHSWGCRFNQPTGMLSVDAGGRAVEQVALSVQTEHGPALCPVGSWIVKDGKGGFYIYGADAFKSAYELI